MNIHKDLEVSFNIAGKRLQSVGIDLHNSADVLTP